MHRITEKNASNTYYFFFVTQYFISISKNPIFTGFYGNRKNDKHIMDGLILVKNRLNIVFISVLWFLGVPKMHRKKRLYIE